MGIVVRAACSEDAQLIASLTRACWSGKVTATSSGHVESEQRVQDDLRRGGGFLLLQGERAVGTVRYGALDDEPDVWEISRMGVLPECRGANLSQHLLEAVIHEAQDSGVDELRLAVRSDQPKLIDFYSAFGFELAEELEYSHANPHEPSPWVMRRILR